MKRYLALVLVLVAFVSVAQVVSAPFRRTEIQVGMGKGDPGADGQPGGTDLKANGDILSDGIVDAAGFRVNETPLSTDHLSDGDTLVFQTDLTSLQIQDWGTEAAVGYGPVSDGAGNLVMVDIATQEELDNLDLSLYLVESFGTEGASGTAPVSTGFNTLVMTDVWTQEEQDAFAATLDLEFVNESDTPLLRLDNLTDNLSTELFDVHDTQGTEGQIRVFDADTGLWTPVTVSGDATLAANGAVTVSDDSHAHTGATISGLDISDDTNLSASDGIVLTGDALSHDSASGYKHIPSGGSANQILQYASDGTAAWVTIGGDISFSGGTATIAASAKRPQVLQFQAGLTPSATDGCDEPALDENGNWGAAFNTGESGFWDFALPSDFDGSIERLTLYWSGPASPAAWAFATVVLGDSTPLDTAYTVFGSPTTIGGTPEVGDREITVDTTNFSSLFGTSENAGKQVKIKITLVSGDECTFSKLVIEY